MSAIKDIQKDIVNNFKNLPSDKVARLRTLQADPDVQEYAELVRNLFPSEFSDGLPIVRPDPKSSLKNKQSLTSFMSSGE
jgi:hypothetical protein